MPHLRLVPSATVDSQPMSEAERVKLESKRAELEGLNADTVLAVRDYRAGDHWEAPLNMITAKLEDFVDADMAPPAIVLKELVSACVARGVVLTEKQLLALNNFVACKKWNMPGGSGGFLVLRESDEMVALKDQIEVRRDQLLRQHLGRFAKVVDDLANMITIHWNDSHTETLVALKERAKNQAGETTRSEGLGGLAFLQSLARLDAIGGESQGNVVSLENKRLQKEATAHGGAHQAALRRFQEMLSGGFMMSHVAINDEDELIRRAARSELGARRFIEQQVAQAAIPFWQAFVKKELADLQFEV